MEHSNTGDDLASSPRDKGMHDSSGHACSSNTSSLVAEESRHNHVRRTRHVTTVVLFSVMCLFFWRASSARPSFHTLQEYNSYTSAAPCNKRPFQFGSDFNWTDHLPTKQPNWTSCYEFLRVQYQCARLSVPLDYSDPDGEQAAIALVRHKSPYPPGHEKYKGSILFNPGGPGGSGVTLILSASPSMRKLIGDEFDFIGFDPRGVLFTTPGVDVFKTTIEAAKFTLEMPASLNASSSAFSEAYVRSKLLGKLAEMRAEKYASFVSTVTVATDMLSIVNAIGSAKLQFWGFSYGSVLGATFAAMFPNKVGRIVIDGVVDSEDYYAGLWSNNLRDTDAALLDIFQSCVHAGPEKCDMYEHNAGLIAVRINRLLAKIKAEPVPYLWSGNSYGLIDYSSVKNMIFSNLYRTHGGSGRILLSLLAALERGDQMGISRYVDFMFKCECPESGNNVRPWGGITSTVAIACGDAAPINETLEDARAVYEKMAQNTTFSDVWPYHLYCSGWNIRAKDRFKGSFEQNTSYPLLLIGNTADPVTPLWDAHKMSRGFNNSIVLTQNSSGHCSISATSMCTFKAVRSYFLDGILPEKGTVCQTESSIFGSALDLANTFSADDRILLQAAEELRRMQIVPPLFDASRVNLFKAYHPDY